MNHRERVLTAMRHQIPDRVPFDFPNGFAPAALAEFRKRTGQDDPYEYFQTDCRGVGPSWESQHPLDHSRYHHSLPPRAWVDEWGIGHLPTESKEEGHAHLEGFIYPMLNLRTKEDAQEYPLPDIEAEYRYCNLPEQIRDLQAREYCVVGGMACTVFEIAWYMRSMELLLMDFVDNPEFATTLLDRITEKRVIQAERMSAMGVDILSLGDDIASQRGMLMSVPMWRKWLKPRLKEVIDSARKANSEVLIFYHTDGDGTAIVPDLIEIGIQILNPVQAECMDGAALKREYGKDLAFWGTIGTQTTLPFGAPDDVRREVKIRMETMGDNGGLCLAPTHMVEPDVPWENLAALAEAVETYGRYG
jgi:uroporphyrinogen decarboxylase